MKETRYPTSRPKHNLSEAYVNKSNALITASYRLTLNEQRIILAAVAKLDSKRLPIRQGFDQVSKIRIYAAEFAETFNLSTKDAYGALKEGSAHLYERSVQTYDGRVKGRFRWISKEEYADGEGYVQMSFTPDAANYLTALRNKYTSYQLKRVSHLTGIYSIRLFEFLIMFRKTGVFKIPLDEFITRLELPYERWIHIKQRVIEPAIKELGAKSNLDITYEAEKVGRRIAMLVFRFTPQAQGKLNFLDEFEDDLPENDLENESVTSAL